MIIGFLKLTHKDSNLERQDQNLLCYRLHHGSIMLKATQIYNKKVI